VWPDFDESKLHTDHVEIPVQINGKLRATIRVERCASQETVQALALQQENIRRHLEGAELRKAIHVPDRMLNLVVR